MPTAKFDVHAEILTMDTNDAKKCKKAKYMFLMGPSGFPPDYTIPAGDIPPLGLPCSKS